MASKRRKPRVRRPPSKKRRKKPKRASRQFSLPARPVPIFFGPDVPHRLGEDGLYDDCPVCQWLRELEESGEGAPVQHVIVDLV